MNRPVDECKKKMEKLLSSLGWEKMKMRKSNGTGKGDYF
jgi:predicted RNA binding protein YcfA (HicA-like mRNA interferase family)